MTREQHLIAVFGKQLSRALDELLSAQADSAILEERVQTLEAENAALKAGKEKPTE